MKVTSLKLENFLSYRSALVNFDQELNVITGQNAAGKTNLIDGIFYASVGRGSRMSRDKDLINMQSTTGAKVTVIVQKKYSKHTVEMYIDPQGKKRVLVDGLPIQRIGELMGVINVVMFSPDELKLVKEKPMDRRRFLDISLSQQSKLYFYNLTNYNKLLEQRNKILKAYAYRPVMKDMLATVENEFCASGTSIIKERSNFIQRLAVKAGEIHNHLTGGKEELKLGYESEPIDMSNPLASYKKLLSEALPNDERLQYTTFGPHRDDIKISVNDVDIRKYGSQGQQKTAVLSLKLAEIALFEERTGEAPILLLDDVMSELDEERRNALMHAVNDVQTMITCTEFEGGEDLQYKKFLVKDRMVQEVNK